MRIGVIADTHVPDRVNELDPLLISSLKAQQVDVLIHAGDICVDRVLKQLKEIAPLYAVRGNRDWLLIHKLHRSLTIKLENKILGITHGHGNLIFYLWDKFLNYTTGYKFERYYRNMIRTFKNVDVIIFGHTHRPICKWYEGKLILNPGSASFNNGLNKKTYGLIEIDQNGKIKGEIVYFADV